MTDETGNSRSVQQHYYTCFWPVGRPGVLFCGTALVVIGAAWLATNLELITEAWWEIVIPVLIIGWGAAIVFGARGRLKRKEVGR